MADEDARPTEKLERPVGWAGRFPVVVKPV
jgi:hypothetical protein